MRLACVGWIGTLLSGTVVLAAPLDLNSVPAEAKWLVHIDVDAMHDSVVVEKAFGHWMEKKNGAKHLDKARRELGLDLCNDLHSVTLFNTSYAENEGAVIASAEFDREKLVEKVEHARDHQVTEFDGMELHTWADDRHEGRTVAGAFFDDKTLVMGSSVELVKATLGVLTGDRSSLSDENRGSLSSAVPKQAILLARLSGLAEARLPKKARLPEGIDQLSLAVGELDREVFVAGRAGAQNAETAEHIKNALEGLRSMALLNHGDAESKQYLKDAQIVQSGDVVELEFAAPAGVIWQAMQRAHARKTRSESAKSD